MPAPVDQAVTFTATNTSSDPTLVYAWDSFKALGGFTGTPPISFMDPFNGFVPVPGMQQVSYGWNASNTNQQPFTNTGPESYWVSSQPYQGSPGLPAMPSPFAAQSFLGSGANKANYAILIQIAGTGIASSRSFTWTASSGTVPSAAYSMKGTTTHVDSVTKLTLPDGINPRDSAWDPYTDWDSLVPTAILNDTSFLFTLTIPFNGAIGGHTATIIMISTARPHLVDFNVVGLIEASRVGAKPQVYSF